MKQTKKRNKRNKRNKRTKQRSGLSFRKNIKKKDKSMLKATD